MKKYFIAIIILTLLISCAVKKPVAVVYHSEKLCSGIQNMSAFINSSAEVRQFFSGSSAGNALTSKTDSLITEGIVFPFLQSEIAAIVKNEEQISLAQANKRLEEKFLHNPLQLDPVCPISKNTGVKPDVGIEYYYYPEYALLTAEITKIKYAPEYAMGFLILAKLDSVGKLKILKTTVWQE